MNKTSGSPNRRRFAEFTEPRPTRQNVQLRPARVVESMPPLAKRFTITIDVTDRSYAPRAANNLVRRGGRFAGFTHSMIELERNNR